MSAADDQAQVRASIEHVADRAAAKAARDRSIEHIADRAAAKAVHDSLMLIGIDLNDPIKAQEEFAALRALASTAVQSDLAFLSRLHGAADTVSKASWRTVIRILITALFAGIAIVTSDYWFSHIWKR